MYKLLRPMFFALPPEAAHALTLRLLSAWGSAAPAPAPAGAGVPLMGLRFANRVGLAAGFDKNGVATAGCARLGFGFVEVGTVTPLPQPGRPQPRVFRLPGRRALINRMGFPNEGAAALAARLRGQPRGSVVGVNIGKNAATANEAALSDYLSCLRTVHEVADYVTVNISSPNTTGLRDLQAGETLAPLLDGVLRERDLLDARAGKRTPVLVKISPDEGDESLRSMADVFLASGVDGVIATNTTLSRSGVAGQPHAGEAGGLSGEPLRERSLGVVRALRQLLGSRVAIIGVGGIDSPAAARAMREAGADLVQLYTALVYQGPGLVREISRAL